MTDNITKKEMEKAMDAFYCGDIGSDTATGYKLLNKDEEAINLIGKVLFNLANNKMMENNKMTVYTVALADGTCGAVITPQNQKVKVLDTVTVGLTDENGMTIEKTGQVSEILEERGEWN